MRRDSHRRCGSLWLALVAAVVMPFLPAFPSGDVLCVGSGGHSHVESAATECRCHDEAASTGVALAPASPTSVGGGLASPCPSDCTDLSIAIGSCSGTRPAPHRAASVAPALPPVSCASWNLVAPASPLVPDGRWFHSSPPLRSLALNTVALRL
jgi:hypothetical protein